MDPEPSSFLMAIDIGWQVIIGTISLIVLLIGSGIISGTEVAFFSLSKADLEKENNPKINQVNQLLEDLRNYWPLY